MRQSWAILLALWRLEETFTKDLNYEEGAAPLPLPEVAQPSPAVSERQ